MKIFLTGSTGFVGSAVALELVRRGHSVLGLARSDRASEALKLMGVSSHRGDIRDPSSLIAPLAFADAIIHTAFNHDFSRYEVNCAEDGDLLMHMAHALSGTGKVLIATSATTVTEPGRPATEDMPAMAGIARGASERFLKLSAQDVSTGVVRLPPSVHGDGDVAFVPALIALARRTGVSAYVGEGANRWPAVHRDDAARLFCDAVEQNAPGSRYHAVQDEGLTFRSIAEAIGAGLDVPVEPISIDAAAAHFGWLTRFVDADVPASSVQTRRTTGWTPTGPDLLADLRRSGYFNPPAEAVHV